MTGPQPAQEPVALPAPTRSAAPRRVTAWLAAYALAGACVTLLGWALGVPRLTDWLGSTITMKANTALAAGLAAVALLLLLVERAAARRASIAAALAVAALGGVTLAQHVSGWDAGIDTLLFDEPPGAPATVAPGRMGLPASTSFVLLGTGLVLGAVSRGRGRLAQAAAVLANAVAAVATLSLIGYLFGATTLFMLPHVTGIAAQTASMLLALAVGLVAALPDAEPGRLLRETSAAGALARRVLPLVILVPPALVWLERTGGGAGLYDPATGLALLVLALIGVLCLVLAMAVRVVREHEQRQARSTAALAVKEREERRQRQFLDQLIATSPVAIAIVRGDRLRHELANAAYEAMAGRPVQGATLIEVFPADAEGMAARVRKVVATGEPWSFRELPLARREGGRSWWDGEVAPVRDADGSVGSALILAWQVTDRIEAEAALAENAALFRTLGETVPDLLWMTDGDGRSLYKNPAWLRYTGTTPAQISNHGWERVYHPEDVPDLLRLWHDALGNGTAFTYEARVRRADGAWRWFLGRVAPVLDDEGRIVKWVGTAADIDDRKLAEAERERLLARERSARAAAEHAAQLKDEFLAVLSHELRTPLNAILGWSQLLRADLGDRAKAVRALDVIDRNARLQTQLIADLLDMSRVVAGKMRIELQVVDLPAVVESALLTVRPAADAKGVRLEAVLAPPPGVVQGDPARLQQVVWNLLANAVKFTPRGGQVEVSLDATPAGARITVRDTGEGVPPEFLPHLFERFRQADASTARQHGGLGIGLALVKHLVELHGGTVTATSAGCGLGARFEVVLPLALGRGAQPPVVDGAPTAAAAAPLADLRVLLVDDNPDALALARAVLERSGARVVTATGAGEALAAWERSAFDVIVSDVAMPGEDGYALLRALRSRAPRSPAVALTALARGEERERLFAAGFGAHVVKPFEPAALLAAVAKVAGRT